MHRFETIDLGTYRGDEYFLTGFVDPAPEVERDYDPGVDADEYGVTIGRTGADPLEDTVEIVRMDTKHGGPHLDRLYLPPGVEVERKIWLDEAYDYSRMKRYLLANWKYFVDRYIRCNE